MHRNHYIYLRTVLRTGQFQWNFLSNCKQYINEIAFRMYFSEDQHRRPSPFSLSLYLLRSKNS